MKPRVTLITIEVDDLERALRFYRDGLGLKSEGIVGRKPKSTPSWRRRARPAPPS
jgi:catechol 2,3-dioxygenase-like lactoylglutathione lyase family enzyme